MGNYVEGCCMSRDKEPVDQDMAYVSSKIMASQNSSRLDTSNSPPGLKSAYNTAASSRSQSQIGVQQQLAQQKQVLSHAFDKGEFNQLGVDTTNSKFAPNNIILEGNEEQMEEEQESRHNYQSIDLNQSNRRKLVDLDFHDMEEENKEDMSIDDNDDIIAIKRMSTAKYNDSDSDSTSLRIQKVGSNNPASEYDDSDVQSDYNLRSQTNIRKKQRSNLSSNGSIRKIRAHTAQSGSDQVSDNSNYTDTSVYQIKSNGFKHQSKYLNRSIVASDISGSIKQEDDSQSDNSSQYTVTSIVAEGKSDSAFFMSQVLMASQRSSSKNDSIKSVKKTSDQKLLGFPRNRSSTLNQKQGKNSSNNLNVQVEQDEEQFADEMFDQNLLQLAQGKSEQELLATPIIEEEQYKTRSSNYEQLDKTESQDISYLRKSQDSSIQNSKHIIQSFSKAENGQAKFETTSEKIFDKNNKQIIPKLDLSVLALQNKSMPFKVSSQVYSKNSSKYPDDNSSNDDNYQ